MQSGNAVDAPTGRSHSNQQQQSTMHLPFHFSFSIDRVGSSTCHVNSFPIYVDINNNTETVSIETFTETFTIHNRIAYLLPTRQTFTNNCVHQHVVEDTEELVNKKVQCANSAIEDACKNVIFKTPEDDYESYHSENIILSDHYMPDTVKDPNMTPEEEAKSSLLKNARKFANNLPFNMLFDLGF